MSEVPEYPHLLSIWLNLQIVCSFPVMELRGASGNAVGGFGFTVKWRNRDTVSLKANENDWVKKCSSMTMLLQSELEAKNRTHLSDKIPDCAGPWANSSTVIRGNLILVSSVPRTDLLFSGVTAIV